MNQPAASRTSASVVGAGPAGLIAAETLARAGLDVVVIEAMPAVGRKFLLAGRGGLNLTHSESLDRFLTRYGDAPDVLLEAVRRFPPRSLRNWCDDLGEQTFVGSSGRVFPRTFRANRLLDSWLERLHSLGVVIRVGTAWTGWGESDADLLITTNGSTSKLTADVAVLALGGGSWPTTGSDGRWMTLMDEVGVAVDPFRASNCGLDVAWTEVFAERFAGTAVKNVSVTCAETTVRGELMITEHGLEGGGAYSLSMVVREALARAGAAELIVDLRPDLSVKGLAERLGRGRSGSSLSTVLTRQGGLAPVAVGLMRESTGNTLAPDPVALAKLAKCMTLTVTGTAPLHRAISSVGGVGFDQVDDSLMLRARPGVFVAGEMLDWDAPTGGYLLQGCFATGVAAAEGAIAWDQARRARATT